MTKLRHCFQLPPILVMKIKREAARKSLTQSDWAKAAFEAALAREHDKGLPTAQDVKGILAPERPASPLNLHSIGLAFLLWAILALIIAIAVGIGRGM